MDKLYKGIFFALFCILNTYSLKAQNIGVQAHAYPDTVCPGQRTMLWATPVLHCGPDTTRCASTPRTVQVGTGTSVLTGNFTYPSPYGNYLASARHEYLIHAGELQAAIGPNGGKITSVAMKIAVLNSGSTLDNFTIRMGCTDTPVANLTAYVDTSWLSTVYVGNYTPVAGWNIHTLQVPYDWDGQSDLVIDFCFDDITMFNINNSMQYTATAFQSVWFTASNSSSQCGVTGTVPSPITAGTPYYDRPNFQFNVCTPPIIDANISWSPAAGTNGVTMVHMDTTYANPVSQTTYTVTMTDSNGVISTSSVVVYVDTSVQLHLSPDTFICTVSPVTLHAGISTSGGVVINPALITYNWSSIPAGTAPASGTGAGFANPSVNPSATTIYICQITGPGICNLTDSVTVTLGSSIPVNATVDSITCFGAANGQILLNMTSGTAPYTYNWSSPPGGSSSSLTNLGPGTYDVTVTDSRGCTGTDAVSLSNPAVLSLSMDSTNILCFGNASGTVTANASGGRMAYSYNWNPAAANQGHLTGLAANTYSVTVTDASGCTASGTTHVNQPAALVSTATSTNWTTASSYNGTITLSTSGGTAPYTYSPSPAVAGLPNATGVDTGIYIIRVCDANGCCVADTAVILAPPPVFLTFTIQNDSCAGQCNGSATAIPSGGTAPYTFSWNSVPPGPSLGTGSSISSLCAGTYSVTVSDASGAQVSKDTVITAPSPISITITPTAITCFNAANGGLNATPAGGTAPYTINWNPGGANPLANLGPGSYAVTVTDAYGCSATNTSSLSQPAQVTAAIISTDSANCFGQSTGYADVLAGGGNPPYTYSWSGSTSTDSFANDLAAGPQTITVTDQSGCTATVSFNIGQPAPLLISAIDTTASHCAGSHDGSAIAVVNGGSLPYTFTWTGNPASPVDSITGLNPGNYGLTVTDGKGCTHSQAFVINAQYILNIVLADSSVVCNGYSDGRAYVAATNGYPAYTYTWSPSGSTLDSATGLSAGTQNVTVTDMYLCSASGSIQISQPAAITDQAYFSNPLCNGSHNGKVWISAGGTTGPYTYVFNAVNYQITDTVNNLAAGNYTFTVTDGRGCTKVDNVSLSNPSQLDVPDPAVVGITCSNQANGTISVNPSGATPPYTYAWSSGSYTASTESNLGAGTYVITVTDANGCSASVSVTLTAPSMIVYTYIQSDSASCPDSADGHIVVNVVGGTPGNNIPYEYSINGGPFQENHNFYNLAAGTYAIAVEDSPGCVADTMIQVYQPLPVIVAINPQDSTIALGSSLQLSLSFNNPQALSINSYYWWPGLGLSCTDCPAPVASPYNNSLYSLLVHYGKNCVATATDAVKVGPGPEPYIPNAFTPNGDGVNDVFYVYGNQLASVGLTIYNRWGEKMFDSDGNQWSGWDGSYQGVLQPVGVYVYYAQLRYLNGTIETRQGSITLIR